jgi:hypothetical protein
VSVRGASGEWREIFRQAPPAFSEVNVVDFLADDTVVYQVTHTASDVVLISY